MGTGGSILNLTPEGSVQQDQRSGVSSLEISIYAYSVTLKHQLHLLSGKTEDFYLILEIEGFDQDGS